MDGQEYSNEKRVAIIGASEESIHTIEAAIDEGCTVYALDGNSKAKGLKVAQYAKVVDISDEEQTLQAIERIQPDFLLVAPIGRYLTTTGAVNDALHLQGISHAASMLCTDKWAFHETLHQAGLRDCHCFLLEKANWLGKKEDGKKIVKLFSEITENLTYPAVLKPRFGSGSRGITIINNLKELEVALMRASFNAEEDYCLEELKPGTEYGVDGAVTKDGFQLTLLRKKKITPLPARQAVGYEAIDASDERRLVVVQEYLEKITKLLGITDSLLHCDLMMEDEETPFVIELSARPSGHFLHDYFTPMATGVDLAREMIRYQMGQPACFVSKEVKPMCIRYFDFTGRVDQVPTQEDCEAQLRRLYGDRVKLITYICHISIGEELASPDTGHVLMERGYFILELSGEATKEPFAARENYLDEAATDILNGFYAPKK